MILKPCLRCGVIPSKVVYGSTNYTLIMVIAECQIHWAFGFVSFGHTHLGCGYRDEQMICLDDHFPY